MKVKITGKNIALTEALKNTVEKKIGKLDKFFDPVVECHVTLSTEKNRHIVEVTIPFGGIIIRGEESTDDMYASIDNVCEKLEKQILRYKTKLQKRVKGEGTVRFMTEEKSEVKEEEPKVVKTKHFAVKPMDVDEAILEMELLEHNFFVFKDIDSDSVNVVYKRKDGNYGLIEPEYM